MYILEIMPISKGMPLDTLTYYSKDLINVGDLISVNIKHQKDVRALVIDSDTLINRKQDVKSKDWATKKINIVVRQSLIPAPLLYSIYKASIAYALPTGTILSLLFTKKFWENIESKNTLTDSQNKLTKSILYIVPTQNEVKYKKKLLKGGDIIVSTPCLDSVINENIKEIILSDYESSYYIHPHYKINMGELLMNLILHTGKVPDRAEGVELDVNVGVEFKKEKYIYNLDRVEILRDEYKYITPLISAVTDKLINNLYQNLKNSVEKVNEEIRNKKGKILIYTNRKGESPLSRCYDCGLDMLCPNCNMPLVLHKSKETKYYLCHHCGYREDLQMPNIKAANEIDDSRIQMTGLTCSHCGGWRIMPIGISTGSVEAHLIEKYTFIKNLLYRIDHEVTNTDKKVKDILKAWDENGGILITNDKGLFHPEIANLDIAYSIVISLDGMYSIPDTMIEKRILHILNRLNAITRKQVIVHTHLYENTIFKLIEDKENLQINIEKYDEELKKKIASISPPLEGGAGGGGSTHSQSSPKS